MLLETYVNAQLQALKTGLLAAAAIALLCLFLTRNLPNTILGKGVPQGAQPTRDIPPALIE